MRRQGPGAGVQRAPDGHHPTRRLTATLVHSSPDLLAAVRTAFPTARVSQVYASTELGSVASVTDGRPGISAGSASLCHFEIWPAL